MRRLVAKQNFWRYAAGLAILSCLIGLVAYPVESGNAARDGLRLCFDAIIPSLFPFFVLSTLSVELGFAGRLGRIFEPVMRPLFNVSGACACAFALGFIGGYPVGAKTAISLYEKGDCSREEAERLLSFCNNSGPAFILGVVGSGVFLSGRAGLLLYLAHAAASIAVGMLFRFYKRGADAHRRAGAAKIKTVRLTTAFTDSVKSSFFSVLNICAFVLFFTIVIKLLFLSGFIPFAARILAGALAVFGVDEQSATHLLTGIIELSSGVWSLKGAEGALVSKLSMAAFMLGWAGISVHFQVLSFIGESRLSPWTYVGGKSVHAVISTVFTWLLAKAFHFDAPVSAYLAEQIGAITQLNFSGALSISLALACAVFVVLMLTLLFAMLSGKPKKGAYAGKSASRMAYAGKKHWKNG